MKAQEDVTEGQKRDGQVEEEDPYNEENLEQVRNQKLHIWNKRVSILTPFSLVDTGPCAHLAYFFSTSFHLGVFFSSFFFFNDVQHSLTRVSHSALVVSRVDALVFLSNWSSLELFLGPHWPAAAAAATATAAFQMHVCPGVSEQNWPLRQCDLAKQRQNKTPQASLQAL